MEFSSKREFVGDSTPRFQPRQIVCLEHETTYLYAEVVQAIERRQMCWVRPLMLIVSTSVAAIDADHAGETTVCYDLRQDSDLLWPLSLFRAALDTEVLPLITNLYANDQNDNVFEDRQTGHRPFRQFVQQVWQAHSELF